MMHRILSFLVVLGLWSAPSPAQDALSTKGTIESTSGGFRFPDSSLQPTAAVTGRAAVEVTGQTTCSDEAGDPVGCAGTGQDGESQTGISPAAQRFTDNGDGTITDHLTGLVWLKDADCPSGTITWSAALAWIADLNTMAIGCQDYAAMTQTDWRLPQIQELLSLMDYGQSNPALPSGHPFVNVASSFYFSSTSTADDLTRAWSVNGFNGGINAGDKATAMRRVWPVRGGRE